MQIENIIIQGMLPWRYADLMDSVRLMAKAFEVPNKIFLDPGMGFRRAVAEKQPLRLSWQAYRDQDVLVCIPPLELIPSSYGLDKIKDSCIAHTLSRFVEHRLGAHWRERTVLYVSSGSIPRAYTIIRGLHPRCAVFDVLDENLSFPGLKHRHVLQRKFAYILKHVNVITAVSRFLVDELQDSYGVMAHYLPNAVDFDRFSYQPAYSQPLQELSSLERPLFGFVGALTSWIDFELLRAVADRLERGTVVLVGPVATGAVPEGALHLLHGHPRVAYLGPQPYERVPHFLHQFDVLVLPRNYETHSLASDPLKLYEYMATGKPIVSTAIPSAMRFAGLVYVCRDCRDFISSLERALGEWSQEMAQKQRDAVREMSWHSRAKAMMELVHRSLSGTASQYGTESRTSCPCADGCRLR